MMLKKIILKNIRSYKDEEINFLPGSTLLSGDIGAGKTSILLGIEFSLFGLQPGQKGISLLRNDSDEGFVRMDFEVDDKEVSIERFLKRGRNITQESCSITIDGSKREISVTELKAQVLELLNYPREFAKKQNLLYRFTVYTPQEEMKQIILEDSDTRINTIRHIFGIDKYKKILENTSVLASKVREEQRRKEGMITSLEQDKFSLIEKEEELESKFLNLSSLEKDFFVKVEKRKKIQDEQSEISVKVEEKRKLKQEVEKTNIMVVNKKDLIDSNKRLEKDLLSQISELTQLQFDESKIKLLDELIHEKKREKESLNEENVVVTSKINSILLKNQDSLSLVKRFSNLEMCPTCLQNVDSTYRSNVLNKLESETNENLSKIKSLENEKLTITQKTLSINTEISQKERELNDLKLLKIKISSVDEKKKRFSDLEKSNLLIEKDLEMLEKHTELLKHSIFELGKYDNIFELKQKELEESQKEERMAEIKLAELKREVDVFSRNIDELRVRIQKSEEVKKQLSYLNELENWLSKKFVPLVSLIEKSVMSKIKAEFSDLFGKWFSMLVSDNFSVRLDDDFTPIIEQQDYEIDYAYLSGGERTAVALAYRLSLNQVINSFLSSIKTKDIVILDEPTDGFSEQQLDKMRDVLQQLNVRQLILVSHEQKIEGFVENITRFKKENGMTKIEH